jgi:dGTPase
VLYSKGDCERVKLESTTSAGRSSFRRDFARLLHSPAFRRLQGKTQLFPGDESDFFRNRLTHSLEVAQIAKGIALQLNSEVSEFQKSPIDTDLVELAALAHDLGHPPFGHNGESALDDCMKKFGGFEGNAQTLRLLARVEKKVLTDENPEAGEEYCGIAPNGRDRRLGLNLTYRALAAVLKYDKKIPATRNKAAALVKGYYGSEESLVKEIKAHVGTPPEGIPFKTIECQIMDLADDIAYSTYDLEDSMKGGFSHPMALRTKLGTDPELVKRVHAKVREEIKGVKKWEVFQALQELLDLDAASDEDPAFSAMLMFHQSKLVASHGQLRIGFTSSLVDKFVRSVKVEPQEDLRFSRVYLPRSEQIQIESLKRLNYELIIMSPRLKVVQYRGYELVKTVFVALAKDDGHLLLPEDCRVMFGRLQKESERKRLICDFVSGMTDRYAIEFYGRLRGAGESIFKPF